MPGKSPIYLDNAATSWPKPPAVALAIADALEQGIGSPGRGAHSRAINSSRTLTSLRESLAKLVNLQVTDRVILTSGSTEACNLALQGLFTNLGSADPKPVVICSVLEHNAVMRPLNWLQKQGLIELRLVDINNQDIVTEHQLTPLLDDRVRLVAVTHASNVTGMIQPIKALAEALKQSCPDAIFFVDASQTIGLVELAMDWGIDLIAFSGHKSLLGPPGIGALCIGQRAVGQMPSDNDPLQPTRFGGVGFDSFDPIAPATLPMRFEPGTPNTLGAAGLLASLQARTADHAIATLAHERALVGMLMDALKDDDRFEILSPSGIDQRVGLISLRIRAMDPHQVASILDASFSILVRAGLHCAPQAHRTLEKTMTPRGAVRISPGPGTTADEMQTCIDSLRLIADSC